MPVITPDYSPASATNVDAAPPYALPPAKGRTTLTSVALVTLYVFTAIFGVAGAVTAFVDQTKRNDAGFLMDDHSYHLRTGGSAVWTSPAAVFDWGGNLEPFRNFVGDVDITVKSNKDGPVFIGLARGDDVKQYLDSMGHADWSLDGSHVVLQDQAGPAPGGSPAEEDFWTKSATGYGSQSIHIEPTKGRWTVVVMNADGTPGVDVRASIGAEFSSLAWIGPLLLGLAVVTGSAATLLLFTSNRR